MPDSPPCPTPHINKHAKPPASMSDQDQPASSEHHEPLAIADTPFNEPGQTRTLNVQDGTPIKLDELGPMIVNSNGTLSRISNWSTLSQIEQDRTVRLLVKKRNLERMKKIVSDQAASGEGEGTGGREGGVGTVGLVSALSGEKEGEETAEGSKGEKV